MLLTFSLYPGPDVPGFVYLFLDPELPWDPHLFYGFLMALMAVLRLSKTAGRSPRPSTRPSF
jgi:hypothetical protein